MTISFKNALGLHPQALAFRTERASVLAKNLVNADTPGFRARDVAYPNVNVVESMTDMISASRSFQLNVEVMNTTKTMLQRLMSLGQ